ncbi:MAG: bifunctional 23S rRNA (guanine(2069)-N(7))-methyltransferase RlmK/23S rRNA (guanine(2445)-N(2))-methyltransferase RlmL [Proteobacteria bacterium]|nr:bifunctional 23S rRNA (guanine(2069)-N(7))-methyltransferase RlmK/23S rRNA (guanine(2445)-N(2))-methyltransferase RlmL [Pseudomonadota bacterium]
MTAFFATCPKGMEYLLRDELDALGAQAHEALAGVRFEGTLEHAYLACLHSRLASRVLLPLAAFDAPDNDALYEGARAIDWSRHFAPDASLAIDAVVSQSAIHHSRYAMLRVKDAIVDQCREQSGTRPDIAIERPAIRLNLRVHRDRATLSLDLSGEPLHRRGWRRDQGEAPLKENLAAAMLLRARWPEIHANGGALLDPMCGSGTLLIEGALMAADVAAGLRRTHFGFFAWRGHDAALWQRLHDDAQARAQEGLRALRPCFFGADHAPLMIEIAKRNAQDAGVSGFLQLHKRDVAHVQRPEGCTTGLVITNPPYGERMGERGELPALYRTFGQRLREDFAGWRAAVLVAAAEPGEPDPAHALGLRIDKRYALYNGAIACHLLVSGIDDGERPARERKPLSAGGEMVRNRMQKNLRNLRKYLARESVDCFRVYDADLPEYAAAIDVYRGVPGRENEPPLASRVRRTPSVDESQTWLHVQEYAAPASVDAEAARVRLRDLVHAAGEALDVPRARIALKTRRRGKGGSKYGRFDEARGGKLIVQEGGLEFEVDLFSHLDSGLFLDHRLVRARLRELAGGKRFLNLFAYTGSASVYAAAGGAAETVSVDLSATYLEWASRNLARNGFGGSAHRLAQADAQEFVRAGRGRYGLIYVDPPTFSNSSRATDFDVQRDHVALLEACGERLDRDGAIVFSNNARRFRLDEDALAPGFVIEDIGRASIPPDFARRPNIHGCWLLRPRR